MALLVFDPTKVDETPQYVPGAVGARENGDEYVYVQAKGSSGLTAGEGCIVGFDGTARTGGNTSGKAGQKYCATEVSLAQNEWGWVKWTGQSTIEAHAGFNAGVALQSVGNGELDDSGGKALVGIEATEAGTANDPCAVVLYRCYVGAN